MTAENRNEQDETDNGETTMSTKEPIAVTEDAEQIDELLDEAEIGDEVTVDAGAERYNFEIGLGVQPAIHFAGDMVYNNPRYIDLHRNQIIKCGPEIGDLDRVVGNGKIISKLWVWPSEAGEE